MRSIWQMSLTVLVHCFGHLNPRGVGIERFPAPFAASRPGCGQTRSGSFLNEPALELGQRAVREQAVGEPEPGIESQGVRQVFKGLGVAKRCCATRGHLTKRKKSYVKEIWGRQEGAGTGR